MGLYGSKTQTNKSEINSNEYTSFMSDFCHWNDENDLSQKNIENYSLWHHSCAALLLPMAWSRCDMLINAATPERWNTHSIDLFNCCCCCVRVNRTPKIRIRKRKTENRKENGKQERKQKIKISKVKTGESRKRPTGRQQKQNQQISKENRPQKTENSKRKTDKRNIEP